MASYFHSMPRYLENYVLSGFTNNSDVARILGSGFGQDITSTDVARWRRQHRRLNDVIACGTDAMHAASVNVVREAVADGDVSTAKWWLERRNTLFKPTAKIEGGGRGGDLDDLLKQRISESDLYASGVLYDVDDNEEDDNGNQD